MRHPFEHLPPAWRNKLFWFAFILTLLVMFVLNLVGRPLTTPSAPSGIVSYELAGSVENARAILASWDANAKLNAAFSLGFDYVFMFAYAAAIGLACLWAGTTLQHLRWPLAGLAVPLAWGQWLAALLDAVENFALAEMLFGQLVSPWPELAKWCAIPKFALVFLGLVYAFLGLAAKIGYLTKRDRGI